jgi:hypothetical protein
MLKAIQNWWTSSRWSSVYWWTLAKIAVPTLAADLWLYFFAYPRPAVIGFLGDVYNFGSGIWFARDLLFKDREEEHQSVMGRLQQKAAKRNMPFTMDGVLVTTAQDLNKVFLRRKAGQTLSACIMLGLGLTLVLVARVLEFAEQGRVEVLWQNMKHMSF